jgi:hypothetical protein
MEFALIYLNIREDKLSKERSGIGIGGLIFWGWLLYMFFGGDSDKKETKVEKPKSESTITVQTKEAIESIKKETKEAIEIAKKDLNESFDDIKEELNPTEKQTREKIEIVKKESKKEVEPKLKPLTDKPKSTFRKL